MDIVLVAAGLIALLTGGGWLVSGAVGVAAKLRLSPLVIGVTLVGMGTSLPELLTSLRAAMAGAPDIALGNVVGSNIANILLILAATALLAPVAFPVSTWRRDGLVLLAVTALGGLWIAFAGGLDRLGAGVFLLVFALWMTWQLRSGAAAEDVPEELPVGRALLLLIVGFAGVLLGAECLVRGAIGIAQDFGVSEAVIGLTVVAVGTSLPELATSIMAARAGRADLALGNILGSNVFNLLGILGVTAFVSPLSADARFATVDVPVMLGAVVVLLMLGLRERIGRVGGSLMIAGYAVYVCLML
ncbi:calcium/sodium antiporter [Jannaschia sp. 2305UL9-9]|uniref:calcium/sodium antiporter n=1 Tax=Jannaschia sp. 2305UL9-9 TaxID=3121638 RepID=UPI003528197A